MAKKEQENFSNSMYTGEEEVRGYDNNDAFEKKLKRRKIIGIVILLLLVVVFIFLFLKACFTDTDFVETTNSEKDLLAAGKEYFNANYDKAPTEIGECDIVTLNTLIIDEFIAKKNYVNCGGNDTYVKVCKLESKKMQWTPVLVCDEIETYFDEWNRGEEDNLVANKSDVKFKYLGQKIGEGKGTTSETTEEYWEGSIPYSAYEKISSVTYYKYRNKLSIWNLNKRVYYPGGGYYVSSPGSGYTKKSNAKKSYKWYKATTSTSKTWIKQATPTNTYTVYTCKTTNGSTPIIQQSLKPCSEIPNYSNQTGTYQACESFKKTSQSKCCSIGTLSDDASSCGYYKTTSTTKKTYYPSGSSNASGEKTYYPSAPASGYTNKDSATTAYKWYKLVKTGTTSVATNVSPATDATRSNSYTWGVWSKWSTIKPKSSKNRQIKTKQKIKIKGITNVSNEDWQDVTDGYVSEKLLIKAFNDEKITSLKDINTNGKVRYKLKMYYRSRIEGGTE